ncbi:MAG: TolC family protein [bacterium]
MKGQKWMVLCLAAVLSAAALVHDAEAAQRELTIAEALISAEKVNPEMKAALAQVEQARENVKMLKSGYYPNLLIEGQKGYGSPAEKRTGVMGQPHAINPTGGLSSKITLFDATRDYTLKSARQKLLAAQEQSRIVRYKLYQNVLQLFFAGVRYRGQREVWADMAHEIDKVVQKVDDLVRTGQHSVVERLLLQDPVIDAAMNRAVYAERYRWALSQLAIITELDENEFACPLPDALTEKYPEDFDASGTSPAPARAKAEAEAARTGILVSSSKRLPKIQALANMGTYEKTRSGSVSMNYYSANLALSLPLFEGFKVTNAIKKARAFSEEKENGLKSAMLELARANARYDETTEVSRVKLQYLRQGREIAKDGLDQATIRYLSFEGPLNEVREAIRNLARARTQTIDTTVDLLQALGSKAVLNGATPRQ